jgi:hypothetical protein
VVKAGVGELLLRGDLRRYRGRAALTWPHALHLTGSYRARSGQVIAMTQKPSSNRVDAAARPGGPAQPDDPELGSHEAQPGAAGGLGPPVTAQDTARQTIAAMRRGDQPGAEQALSGYLTHLPSAPAAEDAAAAGAALRDLAMKLAETAADAG